MEKLKQDKLQSRYGKFLKGIEFFLAITGAGWGYAFEQNVSFIIKFILSNLKFFLLGWTCFTSVSQTDISSRLK